VSSGASGRNTSHNYWNYWRNSTLIHTVACFPGNATNKLSSGFDTRFIGYSSGRIIIKYNTFNLTVTITLRNCEQW
jgi:hypothetical protein